jgi:hypothetical protein
MGPRFSPERVVMGVSLVALGVVGMMARSGSLDFLTVVHTWWPSSLVLWGVAELYNTFAERAGWGSR